MFRAISARRQERQIVSIQPLVTEKNLCITLVIYQESLHDARSTKSKIFRVKCPFRFSEIVPTEFRKILKYVVYRTRRKN